jgi:hypothetical protein
MLFVGCNTIGFAKGGSVNGRKEARQRLAAGLTSKKPET